MPQSMQRAAWTCNFVSGSCRGNSCQSPMRSCGTRSGGSSRSNSINPVGLPIIVSPRPLVAAHASHVIFVEFESRHDGLIAAQPLALHLFDGLQHAFVILGH